MRVSCAVLFDSGRDIFLEFQEPDIPELIERLSGLDLIIGFNLKRFDYKVLSAYSDLDFWRTTHPGYFGRCLQKTWLQAFSGSSGKRNSRCTKDC